MRLKPIPPEALSPNLRFVHDEIAKLINKSQGPVVMIDQQGALLGPFTPMLHFPQFGVPALAFLRSLDQHATLDKKVREVAILTVGGSFGSRFELYAHEIMAAAFGFTPDIVSSLASGCKPYGLSEAEEIAHDIARALTHGRIIPSSTYQHAVNVLGEKETGELIFLISGYCLIAMVLNGFDMPAPEVNE